MKSYLKAAYIFSILPQHIKSRFLTSLTLTQRRLLEKGLNEITTLSLQQQIAILTEFINSCAKVLQHQKHLLDISIIISFIIFCIIVLISTIVSHGWVAILQTFLYIIQFGGLHALCTPFIIVHTQRVMHKQILELVKPSHSIYDLIMGLAAATAIRIIFAITIPQDTIASSNISFIALIFAITAVPLSEELFFRGVLFLHGGSHYGYIPSWFFASFIFASIHLPHTPLEFMVYFVCSSILCFIAYKFSLFASIIAHMLSNTILFVM
ncbi:MAG: CPBP family intramembrane metalloprotease [Spirochaetes bacterium]|nr:CPBP family intramembrane metalloprotease [Spirochaetota bacterium]